MPLDGVHADEQRRGLEHQHITDQDGPESARLCDTAQPCQLNALIGIECPPQSYHDCNVGQLVDQECDCTGWEPFDLGDVDDDVGDEYHQRNDPSTPVAHQHIGTGGMDERMDGLEGYSTHAFLAFALAKPVKLEEEVGNDMRRQQLE